MNDNDDLYINDALQADVPFDPEQAAEVRAKAQTQFSRGMRYVNRYLNAFLLVTTAATAFCLGFIFETNDNRQRLIALCYLFLAVISGSIVKLWYWIVNTKLSILRDLRETVLAIRGHEGRAWLQGESPVLPSRRRGLLSLLLLSLAVLAALGGVGVARELAQFEGVLCTDIAIDADGSVSFEAQTGYANLRRCPMVDTFLSRAISHEDDQFLDPDGRPLAVSAIEHNGHPVDAVRLSKPILPGEWLWFTKKGTRHLDPARDDGTQVLDWSCGVAGKKAYYRFDITLPPNAEVISPEPDYTFTLEDRRLQAVYCMKKRLGNEPLKFVMEFRTSDEAPALGAR